MLAKATLYAKLASYMLFVLWGELRRSVRTALVQRQIRRQSSEVSTPRTRNIVIVGANFSGHHVAYILTSSLPPDSPYRVVVIEPNSHFQFTWVLPRLCVVKGHEHKAFIPYGGLVRDNPEGVLRWVTDRVASVTEKTVHLENSGEDIPYDILVIALGCVDKYHGIPGAEEFSCSIQTFSSSRRTYQQVNDVKPYGQVTIVGGGLSGVEVAAELRESRPDLNIRILDRGPSVLSAFPGKAQDYVRSWFLEHDVEMRGHVAISRLEQGVIYDRDTTIETDVTVWTAGIQPVPIVQRMSGEKDNIGRLVLTDYYHLPSDDSVFVVGDCASLPFAPSGQAAEAQGKQVAEIVRARLRGEIDGIRLKQIKLKGVLGSLGKKAGFGVMGKRTLMGRVPRLLKSGVLWMSKTHLG